tara:strand:- start:3683 stop:4729 length:1047 start_codon:yes stop_codon:yes gene_type:complete
MAYTTINKSSNYISTKLYTGTGSSQSITGVGFQPDMNWHKTRTTSGYNHCFVDAVRGPTKFLRPNLSNSEDTYTGSFVSFDSDGFSVGADGSNGETNKSGDSFVSWNWKANGTGSSNTDGTITSTVSVNTTAGFSIVKYVGNTVAGATVGHGLGAVPSVIMIKQTTGSTNWTVYHKGLGSHAKYLYLDASNAETTDSGNFDNVPTSSAFLLGSNSGVNAASGSTYIAYCFAEKAGYSKFGSYTGNGSTDGPFCYTGFRPDFLIVKRIDTANDWNMQDTKRSLNGEDKILQANNNDNEKVDQGYSIDKLSNGFKCRASGTETNADGGTYIYMAFGQSIVGSNNVPATAR